MYYIRTDLNYLFSFFYFILQIISAWAQMYILFGLLVVTSIYLLRVEKTFIPVANQLPFDMATSLDLEIDLKREKEGNEDWDILIGIEDYIQHSMRAIKVERPNEDPLEEETFCI